MTTTNDSPYFCPHCHQHPVDNKCGCFNRFGLTAQASETNGDSFVGIKPGWGSIENSDWMDPDFVAWATSSDCSIPAGTPWNHPVVLSAHAAFVAGRSK